ALVKQGLNRFKQNYSSGLYLSNCVERTYPRGMDFEIFTFYLLEDAHYNAKEPYELEHVTPYINKNRSGKVRIYSMKQNRDNSMYRLTVDEEDDYKLIKELIETYHAENYDFEKIVLIMDKHPELAEINKNVSQKAG
ncbi:MAG: acylneuraminate cytidylyltransferase, partial [Bacteroidota bacterium]